MDEISSDILKKSLSSAERFNVLMAMKIAVLLLIALALAPSAGAQPTGQEQPWDKTLTAAKKEGKVVVIGSPDPVMRNKVIPAFTARYGISIAYIAGGSSELVGRVRVERASGIYSVDVFMAGNDTTVNVLYAEKLIDPLKPLMVLREVVDGSNWKMGKLWFVDPEETYILRLFRSVTGTFFINADHVKPEEIRAAADLLNPKWKGKIATEDPTISGSGSNGAERFYVDLGPEFVRKLYVDQKPLISRDRRQLSDLLARGAYPICLTCRADDVQDLRKSGFNVTEIFELAGSPNRVRPGPFLLTLANKAPNPNAARVFANWMAGKEALEIYSRNYFQATLRTDIDESFLDPHIVPRPGVTYADDGDFAWIASGRKENNDKVRALLKRP
jgi:iron(III) transport system substrate-binding protein